MRESNIEVSEILINDLCLQLTNFNKETEFVSPEEFGKAETKIIQTIESVAQMTGVSLVEIAKKLFKSEQNFSDKEMWYLSETITKAGIGNLDNVGTVLVFIIKALGGNLVDEKFVKETAFRFCRAFNYRGGGSGTGGHIIRAAETLYGFSPESLEKEFKGLKK